MDTPVSRAKESWMEPLQPTVRQGVVQLKDFITKLVDIEEKEGKDFTIYHAKACVQVRYLTLCTALPCPLRLSLLPTLAFLCFVLDRVSGNPRLAANSLPRITLNPSASSGLHFPRADIIGMCHQGPVSVVLCI